MSRTFSLEIVAPDRTVLSTRAVSLIAPGTAGSLGILGDHTPLMTSLKPGVMTVRYPDQSDEELAIGGGFLEVCDNHVVVLADSAERAADIDVELAREALERARAALADPTVDPARARQALDIAMARLKVAAGE